MRMQAAAILPTCATIMLLGTAQAAPPPARPTLSTTFSANVWSHNYASGSFNQTTLGPVSVDGKTFTTAQAAPLADGRVTRVVYDYGGDHAVWSLQPFFQEHVCYIYPAPQETFQQALSDIWCPQGQTSNMGCMSLYEQSAFEGTSKVDGIPCTLWGVHENKPPKTVQDTVFCVSATGGLLSLNLTFHGQQTLRYGNPPADHTFNVTTISHNLFQNFSHTPEATAFSHPPASACVDVRPLNTSAEDPDELVNHPARLARVDAAARKVGWRAGANPNFEGKTVSSASAALGMKLGALRQLELNLPLPSAEHRAARGEVQGAEPPPAAFDSREKWGSSCNSIATIRNQGACGSCWAFAAAETLADRLCIGSNGTAFKDTKLSVEYLVDCDHTDHGCSGGMLDDAWLFLKGNGLPVEACDPYTHCPFPAHSSCAAPAPPPGGSCTFENDTALAGKAFITFGADNADECCGMCQETTTPQLCQAATFTKLGGCALYKASSGKSKLSGSTACTPKAAPPAPPPPPAPATGCPTTCGAHGGPLQLYKSKSAYAVSTPGDVVSIQRELMTHGPVEVGFMVFSDFMSYHNGTYARTAGAQLRGGHAVKLIGWGVDKMGVDYWIVANSWSAEWAGLGGFFHIRRGTNECGIETTPAAGLTH